MEEIKAIDIKLDNVQSKGVAYYRLTKEMKEFFEKCQKESKIIGFEWDGGFNFGVILGDK